MYRILGIAAIAAGIATSACSGAADLGTREATGTAREPIIGGTVNSTEKAIGMMQAWTGDTGSSCTSTLIEPSLVLTAAHCLEDSDASTKAYVSFETTPSYDVKQPDWHPAKEFHVHPLWGTTFINFGHDCALLVLEKPITDITPKAINTKPVDASFKGKAVRILGYGVTDGNAQTGDGTRREVDTILDDFVDGVIEVGSSGHTSCQGDSGGPTFTTVDGVEKQIGITSYGEPGCTGQGSMTRVDMCAEWIATFQ
jgi:secreted trypsin-like serine protease